MRKKAVFTLALLLSLVCNLEAHARDNNSETNGGLKYFGFALVDCGWDDPHDSSDKTNYVDEVAGFSNVGQMCVYSADERIGKRVRKFKRAGMKAILHIEPILFEQTPDPSSPSGVKISLRPDAAERWENFVSINKRQLRPRKIAALYIIDEPLWNSVSPEEFSYAVQLVKSSLPTLPTLAIEAYPVVDANMVVVPEALDWIGFDRYDSADPANDSAWLANLETVKSARTRQDQKIIIVASTQWLPYYQTEGNLQPENMDGVALSYYQIANNDPDVVALVGYLWPGGLDDSEQLGARNLPENVWHTLRLIGEQIINN